MRRPERTKRGVPKLLRRRRARLQLSEETSARIAAGVLWMLVALAALGGLLALIRPAPDLPRERDQAESPSSAVSDAWAAAGFGARAVTAYLAGGDGADGEGSFAAFLGDDSVTEDAPAGEASSAAVVEVERTGENYWAVTTVAGTPGRDEFWRIGVARHQGRLVATGLPTPVDAPPVADQPEPAVVWSDLPASDDPVAETVTGWIGAYACGQGDVSRWLAPGVRLSAVRPSLCSEVRLDRWGIRSDGENRLLVVTEAALDPGASERHVTFPLALARRDGRWEVAELLPTPPLREEENR